jgi:hypothetical protein
MTRTAENEKASAAFCVRKDSSREIRFRCDRIEPGRHFTQDGKKVFRCHFPRPEIPDEIKQVRRDLLDLVRDFGPWEVTAEDFLSILRKMPARLYSWSVVNCAAFCRNGFVKTVISK